MDLAQNYDHLNADDEVHRAICKIIRMVGVSLWFVTKVAGHTRAVEFDISSSPKQRTCDRWGRK